MPTTLSPSLRRLAPPCLPSTLSSALWLRAPSELCLPEPAERKLPQLEPGYRGYVAGVLDCDGAIWISCEKTKSHPRYTLRTAVSNTRKGLPDFFVKHFGGTCRGYEKRSDKWKNEIGPKIPELMDREQINVQRIEPTKLSALR